MKTIQLLNRTINTMLIPVLAFCLLAFSGCTDQGKEKARKSLNDFKIYVKEHKESGDKYAEEKWEDIEREYNQKMTELDKDADRMDQEMKESYANAKADWEEFKSDMTARQMAKEQEKNTIELRKTFAPDYIMTDMSNITGKNIALVYTHFFGVVEKNKDTYSKEEWLAVNEYWKGLNEIKDNLDEKKAINKEDNRRINEIRIKYGATKALNKPFAEAAGSK